MKRILIVIIGVTIALLADFTRDDSTQIVTDNNTSLQWQDDNNASSLRLNWQDAIEFCEVLELGGYSDWRLPNFNELHFLADRSKRNPAIDGTFLHTSLEYYLSSSTTLDIKNNAWGVHFSSGANNFRDKSIGFYVRCVRDGQ